MTDEKIKELVIEFHNTYEKLAPKYGYKTREDTKILDFNSPNGKLMYETIKTILQNKKHDEMMELAIIIRHISVKTGISTNEIIKKICLKLELLDDFDRID